MPEFDPKSIAVAVITYYPKWYKGKLRSIKHTDKVRGDLALEFFGLASQLGYQVVCVDGKSSKTFKRELAKITGIKIVKRKSNASGPSKRWAIRVAAELAGVRVIVLSEPEKVSLLHSIDKIVAPILRNEADIVVPKRQAKLFKATYPDYMYESEIEGNSIFNEALLTHGLITRDMEELDTFFGPRAFRNSPVIISYFMRKFIFTPKNGSFTHPFFDPEAYSNVAFFPVIYALQKGLKVKSVEVPFSYPLLQKENEVVGAKKAFVHKRTMQRLGILVNLMHFLSYLEKRKYSGVRYVK